jgi:hypothetical protein
MGSLRAKATSTCQNVLEMVLYFFYALPSQPITRPYFSRTTHPPTARCVNKQQLKATQWRTIESPQRSPAVGEGKTNKRKKRGRSKPKKAPHSPEAPRKRPARSSRGVVVRGEPAAAVIVNSFPTTNPSLTPQIRLNLAPRLNHGRRCTGRPLRRHREKCRGFAVRDQLPSLYPGNHSLPRYYYRSNIT